VPSGEVVAIPAVLSMEVGRPRKVTEHRDTGGYSEVP
jgi:hypothetical protein